MFTTPTSDLLTQDETAEFLRANARTLERCRSEGGGPTFVKVGRKVVYRLSDLEAYLARQRHEQTVTQHAESPAGRVARSAASRSSE